MSLYDEVVTVPTLAPATLTAGAATGSTVDRAINGGMADAVVVVTAGAVEDGTHTVAVQDSANGSTGWTAVPAGQLRGTVPVIDDGGADTVYEIGVVHSRRYLRVVVTTAGATDGAVVAAAVLLGRPRYAPVAR
ncbi:hypothetical protein FH609_004145 [Streptomyces sp. 3MP-14]|uniref:Uncharacterized protein n=1 Tax=Streptomyces mimosae TaxID=2586635 RepID=A0A5N6A4T0_9ACTN|nr:MULTISPECIES: hypothetical protein [Streptomyces]KAB8162926.1 hypothetical protein FH607_020010 [Streptomyces mimosae]KAB8179139.1 hypothetical protein FH609_004145 [Streptomyces sp. 3MP-14]